MVLRKLAIKLGVTAVKQDQEKLDDIRLLCHALAIVGDFEFHADMVRNSTWQKDGVLELGGDEFLNPQSYERACRRWRQLLIQPRCTQSWLDDIEWTGIRTPSCEERMAELWN